MFKEKIEMIISDIAKILPEDLNVMKDDIEKNLRTTLNAAFSKMDLVTREEFDIKAKVMKNDKSTVKLAVHNLENNTWNIPFVIEPSAGVDRGVLAILNEAYKEEKIDDKNSRIVLALKPHLSPIKAAVIPLKKNNEELVNHAKTIKSNLQLLGMGRVMFENSGNIGKNYRRHDEIGTPLCITVDFETLEDHTVTVRDRDTMKQQRLGSEELIKYYKKYFE